MVGRGEVFVGAVGADDEAELDFVVERYAAGADARACAGREDRGGWFEEEEGLGGPGGVEFGDVVAVGLRTVLAIWSEDVVPPSSIIRGTTMVAYA